MILIIDNYDSFTYNIAQSISELGYQCQVFRNDAIGIEEIINLAPQRIVLSPGPGRPVGAGICLDVIREFAGKIPIFGICLGMQAIGEALGAKLVHAPEIVHGKVFPVEHRGRGVFKNLETPLPVTRYHSLILESSSLPKELEVTARTGDGLIMGIRQKELKLEGVQFHPESYATINGREMFINFLSQGELNENLSTTTL